MDRLARLEEVKAMGAAAQSQRAGELICRLESDDLDPDAIMEADALIEAYLHDPYLTKTVPTTTVPTHESGA